jgi:hypothetical protein
VLQAAFADENFTYAEQRLSRIEQKIPADWLELIRLFKLALFTKRDGFDNALIEEPEEVQRVVKIILQQAENIEDPSDFEDGE